MPSLGNYDALEHTKAGKEEIELARTKAEALLPTSAGLLQFDLMSRQRMQDALAGMTPGNPDSVVFWKMADNTTVVFRHAQFKALIEEASAVASQRTVKVFQRASDLKKRLSVGEVITMKELELSQWE